MTDNKVLKVRYAPLPIVNLSCSFMVQVMEPIALVPYEINFAPIAGETDIMDRLKNGLLSNYQQLTKDVPDHEITSVELIECDLLTPKAVANG